MKKCSKCKETKPLSGFHKNRSKKDGHTTECKICNLKKEKQYSQTEQGKIVHRNANKKYRKTVKGKTANRRGVRKHRNTIKGKATRKRFYVRHPNRFKAHNITNNAIQVGKLPRAKYQQCYYCEKPAQQYHHWHGYEPEHWLDVIPVCKDCHYECNRKIA